MINGTICEYAKVLIDGNMLEAVSSESTEIDNVTITLFDLGMNDFENINYLKAIKRVIGMSDKKLPK